MFCLILDGWSNGSSTHFCGVFANWTDINGKECLRLLANEPLIDQSNQNAPNHVNYLTAVLELYGKNWENVICLVSDNTNLNPAIANLVNKPLIGCASHKFQLAVKQYFSGSF